jgi:hypothetical protein
MSAIKQITKEEFKKINGKKELYFNNIYKVTYFFKQTFYKIK